MWEGLLVQASNRICYMCCWRCTSIACTFVHRFCYIVKLNHVSSFSGGYLGPNRFWEEFSVQCSLEAGLHRWWYLHRRSQLEQNAASEVEESLWCGASGNSGSGNSSHPLSSCHLLIYIFVNISFYTPTESLHIYGTIPHEPRPLRLP